MEVIGTLICVCIIRKYQRTFGKISKTLLHVQGKVANYFIPLSIVKDVDRSVVIDLRANTTICTPMLHSVIVSGRNKMDRRITQNIDCNGLPLKRGYEIPNIQVRMKLPTLGLAIPKAADI